MTRKLVPPGRNPMKVPARVPEATPRTIMRSPDQQLFDLTLQVRDRLLKSRNRCANLIPALASSVASAGRPVRRRRLVD
jgi:hypothetical protein